MLIPDQMCLDMELTASLTELLDMADRRTRHEAMQFHLVCPDRDARYLDNPIAAVAHARWCPVCQEMILLQRFAALAKHQ